jgi:hypothetical protein
MTSPMVVSWPGSRLPRTVNGFAFAIVVADRKVYGLRSAVVIDQQFEKQS